MPANVGQMFYFGEVPWHGEGLEVKAPLAVDAALKAAGLDWEVEKVPIQSAESPPSAIARRQAIVRTDRKPGHSQRVLGVAHNGFWPVQNHEAAHLLDELLGPGKPIYHTGGYLGNGEVIWLMARLDRTIQVGDKDVVEPYALLANSHDGSKAMSICLTTVRVVCQNTLNLALKDQAIAAPFRRAHKGSIVEHQLAARDFWKRLMTEIDAAEATFRKLATTACTEDTFQEFVCDLLPMPTRPDDKASVAAWRNYESKSEEVLRARKAIAELRGGGQGADLPSAHGTLWGALNAATEFVDHQDGASAARVLLGREMRFKQKAYELILKRAPPPSATAL